MELRTYTSIYTRPRICTRKPQFSNQTAAIALGDYRQEYIVLIIRFY